MARWCYHRLYQRESYSYYDLYGYGNDQWLYGHCEYDHHGEPASIRIHIGYGDFRRCEQRRYYLCGCERDPDSERRRYLFLARWCYHSLDQRESYSDHDLYGYGNDQWLHSHCEYDHHGEPASISVYIGYGDFRCFE